jgi:hypothetical protein
MPSLRRTRGALLRVARRRTLAFFLGLALAAPAACLQWSERLDVWWMNGLSLVLGATGGALIWTAITGPRGDWVEED